MIRLSICIATLNRGAYIGETLASIVEQLTPETELVVVDGASTDNTAEVVKQFAVRCPALRYVCLEKKGGVDQDYNRAVELAQGEYCWLFTDDDLLKPGAVGRVLAEIRKGYSLVVVNAEVRSPELKVRLKPGMMDLQQDRVCENDEAGRDQLLAISGMFLSFIGAVVIRRDLWMSRNRERYFGSLFIHVGVIFQAPLPGPALLMAEPWIVIRYANAQWTSRSFEIWMFKWPGLVWSFPDFSEAAKRKVEQAEPWRHPMRLLLERSSGRYSKTEYDRWLKPKFGGSRALLIPWLIARMPARALNRVARLYARWVLRKVPSIGLYDLEHVNWSKDGQ